MKSRKDRDGQYPYGMGKKNIVVSATDKMHAELFLKLNQHKMKQSEFFKMLIIGYLENDPRIEEFILEFVKVGRFKKREFDILDNCREEQKVIKKRFALSDDEVDDIFDLLAKENPSYE